MPHSGHCVAPAHAAHEGKLPQIGTADRIPLQQQSEEEAFVGQALARLIARWHSA